MSPPSAATRLTAITAAAAVASAIGIASIASAVAPGAALRVVLLQKSELAVQTAARHIVGRLPGPAPLRVVELRRGERQRSTLHTIIDSERGRSTHRVAIEVDVNLVEQDISTRYRGLVECVVAPL